MVRIAYLADPRTGNGFYRAIAPMAALASTRGHEVRRLFADDGRPVAVRVADADVLFIHRYVDDRAQQLVQDAKANGVAVVWDNDDDMGAMPKSSVTYRHFGGIAWERRLAQMRRIFASADLVTAPSVALAERFAAYGARRTGIIENAIFDETLSTSRTEHDGLTIGWVASLEHKIDAEELGVAETLQRILDERPDVRIVTIGVGLGLRADRCEHISLMPLLDIPRHVAGFDLGIAPLCDIPFNRARSNIKLKEYAAVGTPWLASPIGPYAGLGERQGGRLVSDGGWYDAISRLIDHPRDLRKLGKRAKRWAARETLTQSARLWERSFADAIAQARAGAS